jgi:hypothetical protein
VSGQVPDDAPGRGDHGDLGLSDEEIARGRRELFLSITEEIWAKAGRGFADPDLC